MGKRSWPLVAVLVAACGASHDRAADDAGSDVSAIDAFVSHTPDAFATDAFATDAAWTDGSDAPAPAPDATAPSSCWDGPVVVERGAEVGEVRGVATQRERIAFVVRWRDASGALSSPVLYLIDETGAILLREEGVGDGAFVLVLASGFAWTRGLEPGSAPSTEVLHVLDRDGHEIDAPTMPALYDVPNAEGAVLSSSDTAAYVLGQLTRDEATGVTSFTPRMTVSTFPTAIGPDRALITQGAMREEVIDLSGTVVTRTLVPPFDPGASCAGWDEFQHRWLVLGAERLADGTSRPALLVDDGRTLAMSQLPIAAAAPVTFATPEAATALSVFYGNAALWMTPSDHATPAQWGGLLADTFGPFLSVGTHLTCPASIGVTDMMRGTAVYGDGMDLVVRCDVRLAP